MALNARIDRAGYRTFVVSSDGESNEGSVWEAALHASKHKLSSLTVIVDYNKQQSYGATAEVCDLEPFAAKWRAFGFAALEVDGHDVAELRSAFAKCPLDAERPSAIICHTVKGKGVDFTEGNPSWHHKSGVSAEEIGALRAALGRD
jgi:transketolase